MSYSFFIKARTEPVDPGLDRFGSGTSTILYDAPSQEAAEQWARAFVEKLLLTGHPEQKLVEIKVLPIHDQSLTSKGPTGLDWPSLMKYKTNEQRERGSSMMHAAPNAQDSPTSSEVAPYTIESLKRYLPNAEEWNWRESKQSWYVVYHESRAFIVQATNMFLVWPSYVAAVQNTPDGDCKAYAKSWPGMTIYNE